ncbi:Methylthioribulose-1-phosphate dehydratase [Exophiala mesophila]|uniref:Methylthioribulose-1-phosphate dehydratase n=1 Tax=Exophiala mesophila TaxID=212818 RepID=A0A438NBU1_EXOME|nr:Methylthioribulose-1-phosphate dehydratase [Exophiala mesophila]
MSDTNNNDQLVQSQDPDHPANLIPRLCRQFYTLGWVTGTGGGTSIRKDDYVYIAPSGVQKELIQPENMFVLSWPTPKYPPSARNYVRKPFELKPSAFEKLHGKDAPFEISNIEQIKGIPKGPGKGMLGFHDTLRIPIIENTPFEEDLTEWLEKAMDQYPDTYAVLVRRHGIYVWGDTPAKAKTQCESLDYLFQLAVEMHKLGLPWT